MAYIAVAVPSDIVYVAGTINDVDTVFHETNGKWYGYAEAVEDGTYHLWVEMYDEAGNRSEYRDSIYYELPWFVTDRTQEDTARRTKKAFLNAADLNRIEKNAGTIGVLAVLPISAKTDWKTGDLPRESDWQRIRGNVERIRNYAHRSTTPETPGHPINHYGKINAIEQILKDAFDMYVANKKNMAYAGEIYAGEGGLM